jgi:hypothetical protein
MVPNARVENRLQGGANLSLPPLSEIAADQPNSAVQPTTAMLASQGAGAPSIRYSSEFLAQLFAQLPASSNASLMSQLATDNAPTSILDNRLIEMFSMVKYKPSYASKPLPQPSGVEALLAASEAASASRQAGTSMTSRLPAYGAMLERAANNNERFRTAGNDNRSSSTPRPAPSLVRPTGVGAYAASAERNLTHLRPVMPQPVPETQEFALPPVPAVARDENAA